jgi:pilus assembly protein CpaE
VTNVLLVAVDPGLGDRVSSLSGHRVVRLDDIDAATVADQVDRDGFHPDIIFVGSGASADQSLRHAEVVRTAWPTIAVVLVADPDKGLVRRATKVGIRGVIRGSISDQELTGLIERAGNRPSAPETHDASHHLIVVASPKGGVGKTTSAANLAAVLAESAPWEVVLADLDLQFGDISATLDIRPDHTIADAFAAGGSDSMLVRTLLSVHADGFYVLCGADGPADSGGVTGDQVRKLLNQLSASFRFVIVDTSAGLLEETLSSLEEASDVVFVTALDVATLRATRKELDVLTDLGLMPGSRHVLLNRSDRRTGLTVRDAERMLGVPVDAVVPLSDKIPLAGNHGELAVRAKRSSLRSPLETIVDRICDVRLRRTHRGEKLP